MKTKLIATTMLVIFALSATTFTAEAVPKKQKTSIEASKDQLKERASKAARKETKTLKKEGWVVAPGALPIEKQLDRSYMMQLEYDDDANPKYIMSEAMSIGENYDGAKMQALELAKQNLAGQVETQMAAIIESSVSNSQLNAGEAATITETVSASKNLITQRLGRTIPIVEVYRTLKNGNKEVLVRIAYNSANALDIAKTVVKEELKKRSIELHNQLDEALGF